MLYFFEIKSQDIVLKYGSMEIGRFTEKIGKLLKIKGVMI